MELPGSAYLYTLATLAMTFAGFCAIVIVLRQTTGKDISVSLSKTSNSAILMMQSAKNRLGGNAAVELNCT